MTRRLLVLAALAALLASAAAIAPAAGKRKTINVNITGKAKIIESTDAGSRVAGLLQGSLGKGALDYTARLGSEEQRVDGTGYFRKGSVSGGGEITLTPQPDGSVRTAGEIEVTSGSGRYSGAKGTLDFEGVLPADRDAPIELSFEGKISVRR